MLKAAIAAALAAATTLTATTLPAAAEGLAQVKDKSEFVDLVSGRALTRLGITLEVTPGGQITGRAFGTPVTGAWRWDAGLFCRDLYFGKQDLGPNCQMVQTDGRRIRFISDGGTGEYADLTLK